MPVVLPFFILSASAMVPFGVVPLFPDITLCVDFSELPLLLTADLPVTFDTWASTSSTLPIVPATEFGSGISDVWDRSPERRASGIRRRASGVGRMGVDDRGRARVGDDLPFWELRAGEPTGPCASVTIACSERMHEHRVRIGIVTWTLKGKCTTYGSS